MQPPTVGLHPNTGDTMHYYSSLTALLANADPTGITAYDVANTLRDHTALDEITQPPLSPYTVTLTRADGETMTSRLDTDNPSEREIRSLHSIMLKWLEAADMSDDQLDALAKDLAEHSFYGMSVETDPDSRNRYLAVNHENGHSTLIEWDRRAKKFACEEIAPAGDFAEYMADSTQEILARLAAQAKF